MSVRHSATTAWLILISICARMTTHADEPTFPFVISYDAPANVTNVASWLDKPAGSHGHVRAVAGHLATAAGPIRFWATNSCFDACFPSHEEAEQVAARLARFGIGCVRMHHMDSRHIWGNSKNKLTIDPEMLERLDYFIYQLKQHGVYTNLNLHVSRSLGPNEGFPNQEGRPKYDKGICNFEPRMIAVQKQYARDLLTHVNPYTKTAYTEDPAIAFVEISNEDALFRAWERGWLDDLPEPYATTYRGLWNRWLKAKYANTDKLATAWNSDRQPLGNEMLRNGRFNEPLNQSWKIEKDAETEANLSVESSGPDGLACLRIEVIRPGKVSWHPQIMQNGLHVKKAMPYTFSCWARAEAKRKIGLNCMMSHEPWQRLGFSNQISVETEWKPYHFTFLATQDDDNARITISNLTPGTYEFAGISLQPGGIVGLEPGQSLEASTVPVVKYGQMNVTPPARRDFVDFLWDTERDYWSGMYRYLKKDLGVKALVTGTQLGYGPVWLQAEMDYCDAHSYWNHPVFPGRPWDGNNWYVRNVALVNSLGSNLCSLASRRVQGKPYAISEYNHPAPNMYAAEGFPLIAAFGAFQGWDGIYSFTYSHSRDQQPQRITNYFDIKSDTARLVHMPACAALFVRGDAGCARETVLAALSRAKEKSILYDTLRAEDLTTDKLGVDSQIGLQHRIGLDLASANTGTPPTVDAGAKRFVADTGELIWDVTESGAGYFIARTRRTKVFTGFVRGRVFDLGGINLAIGKTRLDWATVSLVAIDGSDFQSPGRVLLAATGWEQNKGAQLEDLGGNRITLRRQWGDGPLMCEGIPATVDLPVPAERITICPLDSAGNRRASVPCQSHDGRARVRIAPEFKTVWYEIVIK